MHNKGYICTILSAFLYGSMPLVASHFCNGNNPTLLVFFRIFSLPLFIIVILLNKKIDFMITKQEAIKLAFLSFVGSVLTPLFLFYAYDYMDTSIVTTIHFMYPLLVFLGLALFYKERYSKINVISILLCVVGIVFLGTSGGGTLKGFMLALLSAISFSLNIIYLDKSNIKAMNPYKLGFYVTLFASIFMFIYTSIIGTFTLKVDTISWLSGIIMAIIIPIGAGVLMQIAIREIGGMKASLLSTFEPITSIILGMIFLSEKIVLKTAVGITIIIVAIVIAILFDRKDTEIQKM